MFKRLIITLGIVSLVLFAVQTARAEDLPGAKLFETYCAACHGVAGKGGSALAIGDEKYLGSQSDEVIVQITSDGIATKGMPAWNKAKGGKLTDAQITDIVAYLRSPSSASATAAAPTPVVTSNTAPVEYAQTKMMVTQSFNADGQPVLNVRLLRSDDTPVVGAPIFFERSTTFGIMDLGTVKTDKLGAASLVILEVPASARLVDIHFKGDIKLGSSSGKIVLQSAAASSFANVNLSGVRMSIGDEPLLKPEGSWITSNPPLVPTLLFTLVVLGVWSMYGYVISQVIGIWKSKPNPGRENKLKTTAHRLVRKENLYRK